jgi:DNA segregation ATPase FtsK/SpoIIIE, S-DNA-T family
MTDKDQNLDIGQIALKCAGLKFPVFYVRTETGPKVRTHYFRQQMGTGAPLSNIINRSEDIAFACNVETCMITRVRNEIAFAIPLQQPELIRYDNAIHWMFVNGEKFQDMALPLMMGQTPTGEYYVIDLATQPHLLVAGSTGAGKSVWTAEILCSLALLKKPSELQMFLVDTKQLDLTLFEDLKHVRAVVTKVRVLHQILDDLMKLVRKRTELMKGKARKVGEWNELFPDQKMSYKLLVIDELADVMDSDRAEFGNTKKQREGLATIEDKLKSLTQISRAAGVHVIAATQRPSVEVISGDIKTNFPMRLSFKLPTSTDSRVILGEGGAENLLGKGDYLYQSFENPDIRRGHGAYIGTEHIKRIIADSDRIRESMEAVRTV